MLVENPVGCLVAELMPLLVCVLYLVMEKLGSAVACVTVQDDGRRLVLTGPCGCCRCEVGPVELDGVLGLLDELREREEVRARCPSGRRGVCPTGRAAGVLLKLVLWEMMPNRAATGMHAALR